MGFQLATSSRLAELGHLPKISSFEKIINRGDTSLLEDYIFYQQAAEDQEVASWSSTKTVKPAHHSVLKIQQGTRVYRNNKISIKHYLRWLYNLRDEGIKEP